jgi:predicted amidohydrolase
MTALTVSLAQMTVRPANPRANWDKAKEMITEAARRGSDLIVLPELWDSGYALDKARDFASALGGGLFAELVALSRTLNIHIIGSMLEKRGVSVCNSAALFSPRSGVLGVYRKIHLFEGLSEPQFLSPGESPLTLDLPWGRTSVAICYDLRFPELMRRYFVEGSKVLLLPAEWPQPRIHHWRTLVQARAIENQMFVMACNCIGDHAGTIFGGHSMVVDPWGEVLCEAGEAETILTIKVESDQADEIRTRMPVINDRRPHLYG